MKVIIVHKMKEMPNYFLQILIKKPLFLNFLAGKKREIPRIKQTKIKKIIRKEGIQGQKCT